MAGATTFTKSGNNNIDSLMGGIKWDTTSLTYSLPTADYYDYTGSPDGQIQLTSLQQSAAHAAMRMYASFTGISFTQITEGQSNRADIRIGATTTDPGNGAGAWGPGTEVYSGDAWFDADASTGASSGNGVTTPEAGNYGWFTFVHEVGHTLGLKHPHDEVDNFTVSDVPMAYSIMSYRGWQGASVPDFNWDAIAFASTPMMYDIAALQYMYGADYGAEAHNGDTVYSWSKTTGQFYIDGLTYVAEKPKENKVFMTLWDGGGHDTYDLSNYSTSAKIDLRPGEWTTTSSQQVVDLDGSKGSKVAPGTVANALMFENNTASLIEDAIGGSGNDQLVGNQIDNSLNGGAGADDIYGDIGSDTLDGGNQDAASDTLTGGYGQDHLMGQLGDDRLYGDYKDVWGQGDNDQLFGNGGKDSIQSGGGDDYLYGDDGATETFTTGDDNDWLHGGTGNDHAYGGGANDTIYGGTGLDSLYGGQGMDEIYGEDDSDFINGGRNDDSLFGGAGDDTIWGGATDNDLIVAGVGADTVDGGLGDDDIWGDAKALRASGLEDALKGGGGKDTVHGGGGSDTIYGDYSYADSTDPNAYKLGADDDVLFGEDGNDNIYAGGGNDKVYGGDETSGGDYLFGGDGNDTIYAGIGNDYVNGGKGQDYMEGSLGNDSYFVNDKNDIIKEGKDQGYDYVYQDSYSYTLSANIESLQMAYSTVATRAFGSDTNNTIYGNKISNLIEGNGGSDFLVGYDYYDTLKGGVDDDDVLKGGAGSDFFMGGKGDDSYYVDAEDINAQHKPGYMSIAELKDDGDDTIYTTASFILDDSQYVETIFLQTGAIDVTGNIFANRIVGNSVANKLIGLNGNDNLSGGDGNDTLFGGNDQDFLYGGDDNDVLKGDKHHDELDGGLGIDKMFGGADADDFLYSNIRQSGKTRATADSIMDLEGSDKIDLADFDGKFGWCGKNDFAGNGASQVGWDKVSGGVLVRLDANGDGDLDMSIFCSGLTSIDSGFFRL